MKYNSNINRRRSLRLKGYDYTQPGAYFVTICTQNQQCLFGEISEGKMQLNNKGQLVEQCWSAIPKHFSHVALDVFVVMPNHLHGIVIIRDNVGARQAVPLRRVHTGPLPPVTAGFGQPLPGSLSTIIRSFKAAVSRSINELRGTPGTPVWQRNYYEHIIRNEDSLARIREYIVNNPLQWALDQENPANVALRRRP